MAVLVGKQAPDFTAVAVMGDNSFNESFTLSAQIKDKYAVVFFYRSISPSSARPN